MSNKIEFNSKSGILIVERENDLIKLNFPARNPKQITADKILINSLPIKPLEVYFDKTLVCVFENESQVRLLNPRLKIF